MAISETIQTDNHASTSSLFLEAGCPSCHPKHTVSKSAKGFEKGGVQILAFPIDFSIGF